MIRIALFADIHGKILLPFKMVEAYQKIYNEKVDLILQCGDVGIFPYIEKLDKSLDQRQMLDLLITHDVSSDMTSCGFGIDELRPVLNLLKPALHFYGHTGEAYKKERDVNNYTYTVKIKELEFNTSGMLEEGCMLILENEYEDFELKKVETSFLNRFSKFNWTLL